jgi:hypothetical protein
MDASDLPENPRSNGGRPEELDQNRRYPGCVMANSGPVLVDLPFTAPAALYGTNDGAKEPVTSMEAPRAEKENESRNKLLTSVAGDTKAVQRVDLPR